MRLVDSSNGKNVPLEKAIKFGWLLDSRCSTSRRGWDVRDGEIVLGSNLFVDQGRQMLSYLFGGKNPTSDYVCAKFGVGTGTTAPKVTDVGLESPISFVEGQEVYLKEIDGVDWPRPFVSRVEFSIGAGEANGYLIKEMGLFSGNETLIARKTYVGINKSDDFSPVWSWSIRC